MRRIAFFLVLFFSLLMVSGEAAFADSNATSSGAASNSTDLGLSADGAVITGKDQSEVNKQSVAIQRATRILFKDFGLSLLANFWDNLGNSALRMMFYVYDNYIGSFLMYIPDMANKATYQKTGAPDPAGAVRTVSSILQVSRALGLWLILVLTAAYIAQGASGLSNIQFTGRQVMRFIICFTLLCSWSSVFSLLTQIFTAIGYSFYTACSLNTHGVFDSLINFSITDAGASSPSASTLANTAAASRAVLINTTGIIWNVVYLCSIFLLVIGMFAATKKFSSGDRSGLSRMWLLFLGLSIIFAMPYILNLMVSKGFTTLGNSSASESSSSYNLFSASDSFSGTAKPALPAVTSGPTSSASSDKTSSSSDDSLSSATKDHIANQALAAGGLFKFIIAVWGLLLVVGVLFMKFGQVIILAIIYFLGPILIGLAAHPVTASISMSGLRLLIKTLAYSPMWALTLVMLYLLPNIDFGVASMGINSIMTAFAVFAGLELIKDAKDFAALFASFGGGASGANISPHSPFSVMAGGFLGVVSQTKGVTREGGAIVGGAGSALKGVAGGPATAAVGAAKTAGHVANRLLNSYGKSGRGGGLNPDSNTNPSNLSNYVSMMSSQPANGHNLSDMDRVIAARQKSGAGNTEDLTRLQGVRSKMASDLGGGKGFTQKSSLNQKA